MTTYKYRIYCITENRFVSGYGTNYPTTCYNNPSHTVNSNGVNLISSPIQVNLPVSQQISFNSYTPLLDFNYIPPITNSLYSINLNVSGQSNLSVRIIDTTNNNNIANINNVTTKDAPSNYNLTINSSNISPNPANWELQCSCATGNAPIINNLQLIYY